MTHAGARFLVIVRARDSSLHPAWTRDAATRDWDLVVSYFGSDRARFRGAGETRIDDKGTKWAGLHALLTREDFWRQYDYVWLPDDDLAIDQESVSELFWLTATLGLALTQPALSWESYWSHRITLHHPNLHVRLTNFVEIMAPCFERAFLARCLPTFIENISGWGLDLLWPRLLPPRPRRCAIIDAVQMTHTRRVGSGTHYDRLRESGITAQQEFDVLLRRHGIPADLAALVYAAVDVEGRALDAGVADQMAQLRARIDDDRAAFEAFDARRAQPHSEHQLRG